MRKAEPSRTNLYPVAVNPALAPDYLGKYHPSRVHPVKFACSDIPVANTVIWLHSKLAAACQTAGGVDLAEPVPADRPYVHASAPRVNPVWSYR